MSSMLPPKGFFAGTDSAPLGRREQKMKPGKYILKVDRVRYKQTLKTFKYFIEIAVTVIHVVENVNGQSLVPGSEATITVWKSSKFFDKEFKAFVYCAFDTDRLVDVDQFVADARKELASVKGTPAQVQALADQRIAEAAEEVYMAIVDEDRNPLAGTLVLAAAIESKTDPKEGQERFVNTTWEKKIYYSQLENLLGAARVQEIVNDGRTGLISLAEFEVAMAAEMAEEEGVK